MLNFFPLSSITFKGLMESLREELLGKAEGIKMLPTLTSIINELFRVLNDRNSSFNDLFGVVQYDQAISAKILSVANSAYYGRGSTIESLHRAMVMIGFDEIKSIIMCLAFLREILSRLKLKEGDLKAFWSHSLSVALAAKTVAGRMSIEDPEKVFTVGMLHDIGKVVCYAYPDKYDQITRDAANEGRDLCSVERERFGTDHQELGYVISRKWRFPEEFSKVIAGHHGNGGGRTGLVELVSVADRFVGNPELPLGNEGIILHKEKDWIMAETNRISELLGVADAEE